MTGDAARLEQVVTNLVSNALKYSPAGGVVQVTLTHMADAVRLTVQDGGIGIPPEEREAIFTRFHRAANAMTGHMRGLGLGLYISREIVRAHGGQIGVADTPDQRGSTLYVVLPRQVGTAAPSARPETRGERRLFQQGDSATGG